VFQSQATKPTFRSGVDLVRITAVVQDRRGRPVLGLLPSDFELDVSGERVQILEFGSEATGVSVALLIDDSGSMSLAGRRDAAQEVARHILSWIEAGPRRGALLGFDKSLRDVAAVHHPALGGGVPARGSAAMQPDVALRRHRERRPLVAPQAGRGGRGGDYRRRRYRQRMSAPEVSRVASGSTCRSTWSRSGWASIGSAACPMSSAPDVAASSQASWTIWPVDRRRDIHGRTPAETSLVARILTELRHQYLIAFEASPRAGWHSLTVGVRKKNTQVRARGGYMAGTNAGSL
jgi:hypothetical protein